MKRISRLKKLFLVFFVVSGTGVSARLAQPCPIQDEADNVCMVDGADCGKGQTCKRYAGEWYCGDGLGVNQ